MNQQWERFVVVVAGGSGNRMGADIPKQFLPLNGKPVLVHTVERWLQLPHISGVVVVLPILHQHTWRTLAGEHGLDPASWEMATGGQTRTESVFSGLASVEKLCKNSFASLVAIHDGVRPLFTASMAEAAFELAALRGGAVACVPVKASLRLLEDHGETSPVDRSRFLEVQTPQTFQLAPLLAAFRARQHNDFSDDASLFQAAGNMVVVSPGDYANLKITTPEDLEVAARLLVKKNQS